MKKIALTIAALLLLFLFGIIEAQTPIKINPSETRHGPENGALVIIGGGRATDEIWDKIVELAGGKENARIVVITNASGDSVQLYANQGNALRERIGEDRVVHMHLTNIREANDEKNLEILRQATGVFFSGGRQWRIADVYLNTLVHQELWTILSRGGVIAGTSAGATIQGSFLWRGDTSGPDVLIGDHTQGLGFLRNSVIDQHLLARNRQFDLVDFMNMAPNYLGLGIDESTAAIVVRDVLEVMGSSLVAIYNTQDKPFFFLRNGQKFDLNERKVIRQNQNQ